MNVAAALKVLVTLPAVLLSGMLAGAPAVEKVTLCGTVAFCHSQVTTEFTGTVMVAGVNELFATCTVVTIAEVVVNVTVTGLERPAAVAVAV